MRATRRRSGKAPRSGGPEHAGAANALPREEFLTQLAADFAALRDRPADWAEELEERRLWEATLADGLDEPATMDIHGPCSDSASPRGQPR